MSSNFLTVSLADAALWPKTLESGEKAFATPPPKPATDNELNIIFYLY